MADIVDFKLERTILKGAKAFKTLLANDPELRESTTRYVVAREKLRVGLRAMLDFYASKHENEKELSAETQEDLRLEARDMLLNEIENVDDLPHHYGIPENELSEVAFWVLIEALEAIAADARTYKGVP